MAQAKTTKADTTPKLNASLPLGALVAELVGTFVLTMAVLNTQGNAIVAAVTIIILVLMLSALSGGHINPAITIAMWVTRKMSGLRAIGYLVAQFLGAMLAVVVVSRFLEGAMDPLTGAQAKLFAINATDEWKPFFGELVGALLFGFGVAAAVFTKREGFETAFTVGGSLLLGLIVAASGSSAILNPAVALAVGALPTAHWVSIIAYTIGPIVGLSLGALLYKLLQSDIMIGNRNKA
jgi:glycerol uptake facilitator-like aquaporin